MTPAADPREKVALEADNAQLRTDAAILLATIDWLEECTGEGPEGEDRALVGQIRTSLGLDRAPGPGKREGV